MGSSFSNPTLVPQKEVLHIVNSLSRNHVGNILVTYVRQIGFNVQRLDEKQFMRLFAVSFGNSTHELAGRVAVEKFYHLLLKGSGYGINSNNGIPALQLLAVLYLLSAPEASTPDEKFDAVISLCQMNPLPTTDHRQMFNHTPPNHVCSAAELNLASEISALGLARLCSDSCGDYIGHTITTMVDDIIPVSDSGKQNDQKWHTVRNQMMEHKHVYTFLRPFGVDMMLIGSIAKEVMRNLRNMSNQFLEVSKRIASAQVRKRKSTMRWGKLQKELVVKDNFTRNISKLVSDAQQDAASAALAPRRCLDIILDCSRISARDTADGKAHELPFQNHEADELERILIASTRDGVVDFRFFKVVSLALLTYKSIDLESLQTRPAGVSENCLCYLQRLFNACAPEVGYVDHPTHVTQSAHCTRRTVLGGAAASALAAAAVARSKSYAIVSAAPVAIKTEEEEEEEDDHGLHDLLQNSYTHGVPNAMILTRMQWVYFQCRSYYRHKMDENFEQGVVKFFQNRENAQKDGYVEDTAVVYEFVKDSMCEINSHLFRHINVKALKAELIPLDPRSTSFENAAKFSSAESSSDEILREHIHFLVAQIKEICINPDCPEKGLSMKLIKRNSALLKEDIKSFTDYFIEAHR